MKKVLGCCLLSAACGKVYFSETFDGDWESRWVKSTWKESEGTQGKWQSNAGKWFKDEKEDAGMQTAEDSKFFGASASFHPSATRAKSSTSSTRLSTRRTSSVVVAT